MNHVLNKFAFRALSALVLALAPIGVQPAPASAAAGNQCPTQTSDAYGITLRALTGPGGGDLSVRVVPATPACEEPSAFKCFSGDRGPRTRSKPSIVPGRGMLPGAP